MIELRLSIFVVALLVVGSCAQTDRPSLNDIDACLPTAHKILNESYRSTGYDLRTTDTVRCDNNLKRGWYKFLDITGAPVAMPTTCQGLNRCGTKYPYWLDGEHPTGKRIIQSRVCAQLQVGASCCAAKEDIFVLNCGDFYVYNLVPLDQSGCERGYCAGTVQRCTPEQYSATGFAPCKHRHPILKRAPTTEGPTLGGDGKVEFRCVFEPQENEPNNRFEVTWTFDNKTDNNVPVQIMSSPGRGAKLQGGRLQDYFKKEVGCQVVTYYEDRMQDKSTPYVSALYYFGIKDPPVIQIIPQDNKSFQVLCQVSWTGGGPDLRVEVKWTFGGQPDPSIPPQTLTSANKVTSLDGQRLSAHLNKNIGCEARTVYPGDIKTDYKPSQPRFFGVKVDPANVQMRSSDNRKEVTFTSTIPIVCDGGQGCCWSFRLKASRKNVVYLENSCVVTLCSEDWDQQKQQASVKVNLVPFRNDISSGVRTTTLTLEEIPTKATGRYFSLVSNSKPGPIPVSVTVDAAFDCSLTGDPHVTGFDRRQTYHFYTLGEYTAYQVPGRNFRVQVKTWRCGAVSCVCGFVVQEGNDIIRINGCDRPGRLISATPEVPYGLSEGTTLLRSPSGQNVGITLPSGSEIKITIYNTYMDVFIKTPAYDRAKAFGICGTNDGNPANDFTHPDGSISPWNAHPDKFIQSWSVSGTNSLFQRYPAKIDTQTKTSSICACDGSTTESQNCSVSQHTKGTNLVCKGCRQITDNLKPDNLIGPGPVFKRSTQHKREADGPVTFDPNKKWPNAEGITEGQAKKMCNDSIFGSPLISRCGSNFNLTKNAMDNCLFDILFGGTTDFLRDIASSFTTWCQIELAKDESNYKLDAAGNQMLDPDIVDNICPVECQDHGQCSSRGTCVCNNDWEGQLCNRKKGEPPSIIRSDQKMLEYGASVKFFVSNVDLFDDLFCVVGASEATENDKPDKTAISLAGTSVGNCTLSRRERSMSTLTVAVTKDLSLKLVSNFLNVTAFDPTCLNCHKDGCTAKDTACHIQNVCYKHGQVNNQDKNQECDVQRSTTSWSARQDNAPGNQSPPNLYLSSHLLLVVVTARVGVIWSE